MGKLVTIFKLIKLKNQYNFIGRTWNQYYQLRFMHTGNRSKVYITTPIFYVNAAPHIGHLYTALVADANARWHRLHERDVIFSTGTDEHGLKIQTAAASMKLKPSEYCDQISNRFQNLFDRAGISYNSFIRTTNEGHIKAVQHFWNVLMEKDLIYKSFYEGWYSVSDEEFLRDDEVCEKKDEHGKSVNNELGDPIKISISSGQPVTWTKEENYIFRLSEFRKEMNDWLDKNVVFPTEKVALVKRAIEDMSDLSVSRCRSRLSWGIPVPGDSSQTIYVWLDALINYLTVIGYPNKMEVWPANVHIVGQDILKFHAVYWPAFLMAAGLDLPKRILCHSHWTVDGYKMSKSRGNVVDPNVIMDKITESGFRHFLLSSGTVFDNCNYDESRVIDKVNGDLVNTYLNLFSRTTGKKVNKRLTFPAFSENDYLKYINEDERKTFEELPGLVDVCNEYYEDFLCYKAVNEILKYLWFANKTFNDHTPWILCKDEANDDHVNCVLYVTMETLRVCSILLQPIVPNLATEVLNRLGIDQDKRLIKHCTENRPLMSHGLKLKKTHIMSRIH